MSACNTGYGQLAEGEGIMSLGRAFLYAGCKSVVISLWLANDLSTKTIMQYFYQQLSQGKSKNESLRQAKLSYLESADALRAHPYFWANLVAVGDMHPLSKDKNNTKTWIFFIVLSSIFLLWFSKKIFTM